MGSRTRDCPDQVFELFVEISNPQSDGEGPVILRKYPPDYDQKDVLKEIPKFAFPCRDEILQVEQFVFVLTDIDGMFRYVYCRHGSSANTCLCIMSHLQWFDIFYKMLNFLADIVNSSEENDPAPFLEATFMQDIPLPGVPVTIVAGQHMLSFTVPNPDLLPTIHTSRNLTEYYNAVDASNMMKIFASMLHERRIIITSNKLSRITACIHANEALLYPMHWQHLFIPVLPSHVIDMVTAPMPYLIGVHSSLMEKIESQRMDLGDAVIIDADANEVRSQYDDLEALPEDVSSYLKRQLRPQKVQTSMMESGDAISKAFLLSLVRLIGGYRDALKFHDDGPITFDREAFVQSRTSRSTQAFLQTMLELQIFQQFISGRLDILNGGQGFHDIFEQESIKYADHLNTQSKYKEWLAKKSRKLKITDLRDKAAPAMSSAVHSVNVQRKKVMSKLREFNDNVKNSQKWRGGETNQRQSAMTTHRMMGSTPPSRPPPPSANALRDRHNRSTVYKTVLVEDQEESSSSSGHHGNGAFHQSFSLVNVTMETDEDMKMTLTRSASVDDLLFSDSLETAEATSSVAQTPSVQDGSPLSSKDPSHAHHTSSTTTAAAANASTSVSKGGGSTTPSPQRPRKVAAKEGSVASEEAEKKSPSAAAISDQLIPKDRLIAGGGGSHRNRGSETPPIPVKRGGGREGERKEGGSSSPLPPPRPPLVARPRRVSTKEVTGDDSPPRPPLPPKPNQQTDHPPLIQFESVEEDQFDPLKITSTGGDNSLGPQHGDSLSLGLVPNNAKTAFLRSATYRRAMNDRPLYPDDPKSAVTPTKESQEDGSSMWFSNLDPVGVTSAASAKSNNHPGSKAGSSFSRDVDVKKTDVKGKDPLGELFQLDPLASAFKATTVSAEETPEKNHARDANREGGGVRKRSLSPPAKALTLPRGLAKNVPGGDPFTSPTTTTTTTHPGSASTSLPPPSYPSIPLRPPPPVPRPRPRQSVATATTPSDTSPHLSSSSLIPPPRPSPLPRPTHPSQKLQKVPTSDGKSNYSGAVQDLLGLENSENAAEDGVDDWSNNSNNNNNNNTTSSEVGGGVKQPKRPPQPTQRVSVAVLMNKFDGVKIDSRAGASKPSSSSSSLQQPPPPSSSLSSAKQWTTFE